MQQTTSEIAEAEGLDKGQVSRIIRLTRLAPNLIERMLGEKTLPRGWSLEFLMRRSIPKEWGEQRAMMAGRW
ncbi:hypothetical protein CCP4SC76_4570003 [Gammaproteobacteria bacterium]